MQEEKERGSKTLNCKCFVVYYISHQARRLFQITILVEAVLFSERLAEAYLCYVFGGRCNHVLPGFWRSDSSSARFGLGGPVEGDQAGSQPLWHLCKQVGEMVVVEEENGGLFTATTNIIYCHLKLTELSYQSESLLWTEVMWSLPGLQAKHDL